MPYLFVMSDCYVISIISHGVCMCVCNISANITVRLSKDVNNELSNIITTGSWNFSFKTLVRMNKGS